MSNHPVLSKHVYHPACPPKSSCRVATKRESISHQRNEEKVGIHRPTLSRQDGSCQKHQGVGPQIAFSPTGITPLAFCQLPPHTPLNYPPHPPHHFHPSP